VVQAEGLKEASLAHLRRSGRFERAGTDAKGREGGAPACTRPREGRRLSPSRLSPPSRYSPHGRSGQTPAPSLRLKSLLTARHESSGSWSELRGNLFQPLRPYARPAGGTPRARSVGASHPFQSSFLSAPAIFLHLSLTAHSLSRSFLNESTHASHGFRSPLPTSPASC
jgi:hypothetical protein